jgi:hypothetical protein
VGTNLAFGVGIFERKTRNSFWVALKWCKILFLKKKRGDGEAKQEFSKRVIPIDVAGLDYLFLK